MTGHIHILMRTPMTKLTQIEQHRQATALQCCSSSLLLQVQMLPEAPVRAAGSPQLVLMRSPFHLLPVLPGLPGPAARRLQGAIVQAHAAARELVPADAEGAAAPAGGPVADVEGVDGCGGRPRAGRAMQRHMLHTERRAPQHRLGATALISRRHSDTQRWRLPLKYGLCPHPQTGAALQCPGVEPSRGDLVSTDLGLGAHEGGGLQQGGDQARMLHRARHDGHQRQQPHGHILLAP